MTKNNPRLLMIFPSTLRGGVEEYNLTAAKGAARRGWDVHTAFPKVKGTASLVQDFEQSGITYHPLAIAEDHDSLPGMARHLPRLFRTLRLLRSIEPDVIQITLPAPDYCLGSILACGLLNLPTVVRFGLVPPLETAIHPWRVKAYQWVRSRNQQWVAISKNNQDLLSKRFEMPKSAVACIYNGANRNELAVLSDDCQQVLRQQVRQELGLPTTAQILITVGRLNFQKGHRDLIPAIPQIVQTCTEAYFIWVGEGDLRAELEARIERYPEIANRVLFLGYRSDVLRLLQSADLFVFPTHFEGGQSFAIAEAMAAQLPIVTSDASGIPEVLTHQTHGLIFPVGDIEGLLAAVRWALEHPKQMEKMARNAQVRAQDFTEEIMIQNYEDLWQKLLQASPSSEPRLPALLDTDRA